MSGQENNPCTSCGACCETFRVSFYWSDAASLPDHLIEKISPHHACMAGTNGPAPRCVALTGEVGRETACGIYTDRPSPCRELQPGDDKCNRARKGHGLAPFVAPAT